MHAMQPPVQRSQCAVRSHRRFANRCAVAQPANGTRYLECSWTSASSYPAVSLAIRAALICASAVSDTPRGMGVRAPSTVTSVQQLQTGSLLGTQHPQHGDMYLQLLTSWSPSTNTCTAAWRGHLLELAVQTPTPLPQPLQACGGQQSSLEPPEPAQAHAVQSHEAGATQRFEYPHLPSPLVLTAHITGQWPDPSSRLLTSFPGWAPALAQVRAATTLAPGLAALASSNSSSASASPPSPYTPSILLSPTSPSDTAQTQAGVQEVVLGPLLRLDSLQGLEQRVAADPQPWCAGSGPGDPPLTGLAYQEQCAGELLALMHGARGLVMVQLAAGWDPGLPQPVHNPFVITLLERAARQAGAAPPPDSRPRPPNKAASVVRSLSVFMSPAPGGLGVTAIIAADKSPFKEWARALAGFGAQAALVAESPFYKLLVGRMMGYDERNILHHIQTVHGPGQPSHAVVAAVEEELHRLSPKKPQLPWNKAARGKRK
ncbi:hypothetical protein V8C86DRAFT_2712690 [Haematococcus lacustris]